MSAAPTVEVALALGSNVGDKAGHLRRAAAALEATGLVTGLELSSLYRTPPWGPVEQDWFVNRCAVGLTDLGPQDLLRRVKALEVVLGRVETVRWGPRVVDIDILYLGEEVICSPTLTLPHPGLLERAFVLIPLAELRPDRAIGGTTIREAAARCDRTGIAPLA